MDLGVRELTNSHSAQVVDPNLVEGLAGFVRLISLSLVLATFVSDKSSPYPPPAILLVLFNQKNHLIENPSATKWSLQNFAHVTTAVLSCHVQNLVMIWWPGVEI